MQSKYIARLYLLLCAPHIVAALLYGWCYRITRTDRALCSCTICRVFKVEVSFISIMFNYQQLQCRISNKCIYFPTHINRHLNDAHITMKLNTLLSLSLVCTMIMHCFSLPKHKGMINYPQLHSSFHTINHQLTCFCSSVSTSMNSLSAITWKDFLEHRFTGITEIRKAFVAKTLGISLYLLFNVENSRKMDKLHRPK